MTIKIPVCPECGAMMVGTVKVEAVTNPFDEIEATALWWCVDHEWQDPKWVEVEAREEGE
jgi:hypothetical protein